MTFGDLCREVDNLRARGVHRSLPVEILDGNSYMDAECVRMHTSGVSIIIETCATGETEHFARDDDHEGA